MKKICFLSLMLIAAQGVASAQTQFNVNAGSGIWIVNSNPKSFYGQDIVINSNVAPTVFVGATASKTFGSNFVASIGADLHLLLANGAYKTYFDSDYEGDKTINYWWDGWSSGYLGDEENASNHFLIALPVKIGYQIGKFTPNVGFEYGYSINTNNVDNRHTLSATAGLDYRLSPKLSLTLNYASNFIPDMSHTANKVIVTCNEDSLCLAEYVAEKKVKWLSQRVEIGISYRLGKAEE